MIEATNDDQDRRILFDDEIARIADEADSDLVQFEKEQERKPKVVFKYKSVSTSIDLVRLCDTLENHRVYMPTYDQLNDPLEGTNTMMLTQLHTRELRRKEYRILSFSRDCLLPTLWAYYAGNYTGVCLGFKTDDTFSGVQEVKYAQKQEMVSIDPDLSVRYDFLIKGNAWQMEQEWRLLKRWKVVNEKAYLEYKPDDLVCVLFGERTEPSTRKHIMRFVSENVTVFTVHPDNKKFALYAEARTRCENVEEILQYLR